MDTQLSDPTGNTPEVTPSDGTITPAYSGDASVSPPIEQQSAEPSGSPVFGGPTSPPADQAFPTVTSSDISPAAPVGTYSSPSGTDYGTPPPVASTDIAAATTDEYISNPFLNSVRGLVLTLRTNPTPALLSGLIGLLIIGAGALLYLLIMLAVRSPIISILFFIVLAILYIIPIGTYYVIAGNSARGETVTTGEAYGKSVSKLLPFIGLTLLTSILTFIGFLLLIIPGVIFLARSSLSPLILFEENLGPVSALKRSFSLTKGHFNEMLGALFAGQFLGGGYSLLFGAISVAPLVGRYHDLRQLKESGAPKPKVHWLNYTYLLAILLYVGFIALVVLYFHNISSTSQPTTTTQTQNFFSTPSTTN